MGYNWVTQKVTTQATGDSTNLPASTEFVTLESATNHKNSGFANRTDTTIGFVSATRVFTLAKTGASFVIWNNGVKQTKTTNETITISTDVGAHYVYFDAAGTITDSIIPWSIVDGTVPIAIIYWDGTTGHLQEERHGYKRNQEWHEWAHKTIGTRYESGFTGTFTDTTLSITSGLLHDEDIPFTVSGTSTSCTLWYLNSATSKMIGVTATTPYLAVGGVLKFDNAGTITTVDNNKFVANDVYGTLDTGLPIYVRVGTAQYANQTDAINSPQATWGNTVSAEMKLLYRVIYKGTAGGPSYSTAVDYRTGGTLPGGGTLGSSANLVSYVPTSPLTATNVQGALDQIATTFPSANWPVCERVLSTDRTIGAAQSLVVVSPLETNRYALTINNTGAIGLF